MTKKTAGIWFIFITVTLDMIGLGLVIPSLPDIMRRFVSSETSVTEYFGYFISIYALMQFLASPLLGALSDRFGRRSVLLISLLVAGFDYILMAYAPTLEILFAGRIIAGLTGANITVAMAYIADVSNDENRSANFGMVGAAFGLGFIIGPAIGGLLGHLGPEYPFLVAAGLNLLNFLFGLFILPESLPKNLRRKIDLRRTNPLYSLLGVLRSKHLLALLLVYFFFQLAGQTHPSIWTLYTETRYGWTTAQVGLSLAVVGLLSAVAQGWLTRLVIPKFGEHRTVVIGAFGYAASFIFYGMATEGWMMYAILILSAVFWTSPPALQSLISHKTPPQEQGELQGSLVSLSSLAAIITPLVTTKLFAHFSSGNPGTLYLPGAPYYFGALICFISWAIMYRRKV
ncbi:TCR/Tet family MFS transporter [Bdellovibrio bacteriovorus]|uniref:TCR/Tet family MFS transporter n=1 Tax=Bdellovibrio bacteriovorus TaxID=959 RepID=UPI003AA8273A